MEDWEANISAVPQRVGPSRVTLVVTLGKEAKSIKKVAVDLILDDGKWKISKVKDLTPP
jgi:hypothetical protein